MTKHKNLIITCADENIADFLQNQWYKSLVANVDLSNIDVVVIDYGLPQNTCANLKSQGVILYKCKKTGFPGSIRFRDSLKFLKDKKYDQILCCDGGDIIFQSNITPLFEENTKFVRAVVEVQAIRLDHFVSKTNFKEELYEKIIKVTRSNPNVNVGVFLAPQNLFIKICTRYLSMLVKFKVFGLETVIFNYLVWTELPFKTIDRIYNYIPSNYGKICSVKNGIIYTAEKEKIAIVHNAGRWDSNRTLQDFGFGTDKNKISKFVFYRLRFIFICADVYSRIMQKINSA